MIYKSLNKDFYYEDSGSTRLSYYLTCENETIYTGRAYNPKGIKINIRKLIEDWLWNDMPDFRPYDGVTVVHTDACKVFGLYDEESNLLEEYMVFLSYEDLDMPMFTYRGINGNADTRQKIFFCGLSDTAFSLTFDVTDLYFNIVSITAGSRGGVYTMYYTTNRREGSYYITASGGVEIVSYRNGRIVVNVPENFGGERSFTVEAHDSHSHEVIGTAYIFQYAANPYFTVDSAFTMFGWDDQITITALTNITDFSFTFSENWISEKSRSLSLPDASIVFTTGFGDINYDRAVTVYVNYDGSVIASFTITQLAMDTGGAILGISSTNTEYYLKGEERSGVTDDYRGVWFGSNVFTAASPYNVVSGYVESDSGIVSHIGALGDETLSADTATKSYWDATCTNLYYLNVFAGYYHTLVFPKGLTNISDNYTFGFRRPTIYIPQTAHFPEFDTSGAYIPGAGSALNNIYWNSTIPIPDYSYVDGVRRGFFEYVPVTTDPEYTRLNTARHVYSNASSVGGQAFKNCIYLKDYSCSANDTVPSVIYDQAFSGCCWLEYVNALERPSDVTFYPYSFAGCSTATTSGLNTEYLHDCTIKEWAFRGAKLSSSVTLEDVTVEPNAFEGTTGLVDLTITGVENIPGYLFWDSSVETLYTDATTLDGGGYTQTYWPTGAFAACKKLATVDAPNLVSSFAGFEGCSGLTSVNVPKLEVLTGVTEFGPTTDQFDYCYGSFGQCYSLEELYLPSIKRIGYCSFRQCTSLTALTLGNGLLEIRPYAFKDCTNLTEITFEGTIAEWNNVSFPQIPYSNVPNPAMVDWRTDSRIQTIHCTDGDINIA